MLRVCHPQGRVWRKSTGLQVDHHWLLDLCQRPDIPQSTTPSTSQTLRGSPLSAFENLLSYVCTWPPGKGLLISEPLCLKTGHSEEPVRGCMHDLTVNEVTSLLHQFMKYARLLSSLSFSSTFAYCKSYTQTQLSHISTQKHACYAHINTTDSEPRRTTCDPTPRTGPSEQRQDICHPLHASPAPRPTAHTR